MNGTDGDLPAPIPFHRPDVDEAEIEAVVETLRSGWLTTGPRVREFERRFAEEVGAPHAVAVNSGTAALHLALATLELGPGDEVLVPTMTFAATGEVVCYFGARPVLVDSEPETLNLDPGELADRVTDRTRAVIPVHFGGHPCAMDEIMQLAAEHGLAVIEDAAHGLPAAYRGRPVGSIGDFTCFSFYATKALTTGEGGMLTTADEEAAETARMLSLHGISKDAWKRYTAEGSWYYEIVRTGYKYNLTDVAAAIGLVQLDKLEAGRRRRAAIAARYSAGLADLPGARLPVSLGHVEHAWHLYPLRLPEDVDRDRFIRRMKEAGVQTSVHFIPLHLHPFYRETFGYEAGDFPVARRAYERSVSLPLFPGMRDDEVDRVVETVRRLVSS